MNVLLDDLKSAVANGLITSAQAEKLWDYWVQSKADKPQFQLSHVIYYFGGLVIISALSWLLNEAWQQFGGKAIFMLGLLYGIGMYAVGHFLWFRKGLRIPGGILATVAVCMVPLTIYGFQKMTGLWPQDDPGKYKDYHIWVKGSWFFLEIGTIIASAIVLRFIRFPFVLAPAAFSLFYMSMDLTPLLFGKEDFTWEQRKLVSLIFGLVMIFVTYAIDIRQRKEDFAFWGYLFGVVTFWGGLTLMDSNNELSKFLYGLLNVFMIFLSVFMRRIVFMVFGVIGFMAYTGHLASKVFANSLAFPLVLSALGLAVIFLGIYFQKNQKRISQKILGILPEALLTLRPPERK